MSKFTGFPQDSFQFLAELTENNNRAWFDANKSRYQSSIIEPAVAFITAVGQALESVAPNIQYDTRTNGSGSLMRIYRDIRFSKDKTPYKTNISGMWWEGAKKKTNGSAFGFQLTPEGMGLMGGMFGFDKEQMQRYREAVLDDKKGASLQKVTQEIANTNGYELLGDQYKKVPRGLDPDHPRADLLQYKGLWAHPTSGLSPQQLMDETAVDLCLDHFKTMAPLQRWLADHVV